jgi:hypothetical protein
MISKHALTIVSTIIVVIVFMPLLLNFTPASARPPMDATPVSDDLKNPKFLKDPCEKQGSNLVRNGALGPNAYDTSYGSVASEWTPFIYSGSAPQFRVVNNEGIDGISQQLYTSNVFDAGLLQTVSGTKPNSFYWFRLGWAPGGVGVTNDPSSSITLRVGADPFGGTDPKSSNVIWSSGITNDNKGLNRLGMILLFPARATSITIFLRGTATSASGEENRVWLDAACLEARPDLPAAAPIVPTATTVPPTATTRPSPSRPPATRVVLAPTQVGTATPIPPTATVTNTPTPADTAEPSTTPRYARPEVTSTPSPPIDPGTGIAAGMGVMFVFGAFLFFGIGILWWRKIN